MAADRVGYPGAIFPTVAAQQGRNAAPPPTLESLAADVAQLKAIVPSNSHIMMDVQFHWTNLWFAAQKKDWPFALYQFNEMRGHIIWLTRKSPTIRAQDGTDVDIKSIFDAVDTSTLADVKAAIEKKDGVRFVATYKTMIESCYSCHKAVGRPYLRPMIPTAPAQTVINLDPNATWPE
jgi:trehalose/maltose hydrolase-like predicted phosphorylase